MPFHESRFSILKTHKHQQEFAARFNEELAGLSFPEEPRLVYEPVRYTLSIGGKRVRPYLTYCGCGLCGGDAEDALPAALAVELLHNFTLLHDDIMDGAATRRGHPSVFKKWDISTAILAGDVLYSWAFRQLLLYGKNDRFGKERFFEIFNIFEESARIVCEGQAFDLEFEEENNVKLESYMNMIRGKTAALISGALQLGGAVGGATEQQMNHFRDAGVSIGLAFQIQDDLLDAVAESKKFGKTRGGDIREGKKTFLSILSLEKASGENKAFLRDTFGKDSVDENNINRVINLYRDMGILQEAREKIDHYYSLAVEQLNEFPDNRYKGHLNELLNNLLKREY